MYNNYPSYNSGLNIRNSSLLSKTKWNWNGILNNTQRTLNIINQAIPIINQVKPIYTNARTAFKVLSALNTTDNEKNTTTKYEKTTPNNYNSNNDNGPMFFL